MTKYSGGCLCGAVRYEFENPSKEVGNCHCQMCRKFSGAGFTTYASVAQDDFSWLQGESELRRYKADNDTVRRFCGTCGSGLTFASADATEEVVELALGGVDDDLPFGPDAHIFVAHKANWLAITDDLPQFAESRAGDLIDDD